LPSFDSAARIFRNQALRLDPSIVLWWGLSLALLTTATLNVVQRGLWFEGQPDTIALLAGWAASGGSLLLRNGRLRAILIFIAAFALVAQAWQILI
jgi:hypothetical protein